MKATDYTQILKNIGIYLDTSYGMWWDINDKGGLEYQEKMNKNFMNQITPYLQGNSVAIQAGGNCGYVTKLVSEHFSHTYTFEPVASSFLALCMNLPDSNVHKFQACLGNEDQKMVEMVTAGDIRDGMGPGANYVNTISNAFRDLEESVTGKKIPVRDDNKASIPTMTIDGLCLNACDFIQLDLEGYELYALEGARETINKYKPLLCIETGQRAFTNEGKLKSDMGWGQRYSYAPNYLEEMICNDFGYSYVSDYKDSDGNDTWDRIFQYNENSFRPISETEIGG